MKGQVKKFLNLFVKNTLNAAEVRAMELARNYGNDIKNQIINEIWQHPVSVELMNHTPNSRFLNGRSRGSLFGFLGFRAGTNPVSDLIKFLDEYWVVKPEKKLTFFGFRISVRLGVPKAADLKAAGLVLPWQPSLVWPFAIENPISNLPYFLSVNKGRSKEGIQIKRKTVDVSFNGIPYLSDILQKNRKLLRATKFKI